MDVIAAIKLYLNQILEETGVGMKALLMDKETTTIVSMVFTQSEMLKKEVFLFQRIDSHHNNESLKFIKCIAILRPTQENVELLRQELKSPRFGQYHIYFSNIISKTDIKLLAEADLGEVVKDVQEYYLDYIAVSPQLFTLNVNECYHGLNHWNNSALQRTAQGIISVLLSLKKCPAIRYQASSDMSKRLAETVRQTIGRESSLFDFRKTLTSTSTGESFSSTTPVLLLLDRRFDPITPCLSQWTYQAMLHELLTINNNRINLADVPGISNDLKEVVVSQEHDEFFEKNMYLNYGEIGVNIKQLMDEFQNKTKSQQKVETISDMKSFIDNYPQFKKMSGTVSKHVTLIGELSRLVTLHNLFEVSEAEQELACQSDHSESLKKVKKLLTNPKVRDVDAIRLCMLYALRYGKNSNNELHKLIEELKKRALGERQIKLIHQVVEFSGRQSSTNTGDLLNTENVKAFSIKFIKGLKGVENIYTQHSPLIEETIRDLAKGKLKEVQFPYLGSIQLRDKPQEIIVFIIGGATYEESFAVYQLNKSLPDIKVILGSTSIHNFKSFIDELRSATTSSMLSSVTSGKSKVL